MLKQNVLRKNHMFQDVINNKKQVVNKAIVLYHLKNNSNLRVGISISKKFANAVNRNKYRRQIRKILDKLNLWEQYSLDVVLIVRKPFFQMDNNKKIETIKSIFERL